MAKKRKKPASRGSVNKVILKALLTGSKYGLEIINDVKEATGGKVIIKQPSLYSSLSRFKTKGYVSSYWQDSDIGGRRHYYSLTPLGKQYYQENFADEDSEELSIKETNINKHKEEKMDLSNDSKNHASTFSNSTNLNDTNTKENDSVNNTKITNENFDAHIQNKIENLLNVVENISERKATVKIKSSSPALHNKEVIANEDNKKSDKEIVAEEDLLEVLKQPQVLDENKYAVKTKQNDDLTRQIQQQAASKQDLSNHHNANYDTTDIVEAEIIEEVADNNVQVNPISILDSYKDFNLTDEEADTNEVSDRIKELKNIYHEIKTQSNKIDTATNNISNPKVLTLLEKQRRKASMEKLYGEQTKTLNETDTLATDTKKLLSPDFLTNTKGAEQPYASKSISANGSIIKNKVNNLKKSKLKTSQIFRVSNLVNKKSNASSDERFYIDENGILKLKTEKNNKPKRIIDNVIYRNDNYGNNINNYKDIVKPITKPSKITSPVYRNEIQLNSHQREEKIKEFDKRFQNLTNKQIEKRKKALSALNLLDEFSNIDDKPKATTAPKIQQQQASFKPDLHINDDDDPIVFEGSSDLHIPETEQQSQTQSTKSKSTSMLNLQQELQDKDLFFKSYSNEDYTNQPDVKFLLSNKVKFVYGWIMLFLMLTQFSVFIFILNRLDMLYPEDITLLQISFATIILIALYNILPYLFNKNKRKTKNFKFTYSLLFGIFAFILVAIISYAVNTLFGFEPDNFEFYIIKLFTPLVLAFNFVISPFVYKLLLNRKAFY